MGPGLCWFRKEDTCRRTPVLGLTRKGLPPGLHTRAVGESVLICRQTAGLVFRLPITALLCVLANLIRKGAPSQKLVHESSGCSRLHGAPLSAPWDSCLLLLVQTLGKLHMVHARLLSPSASSALQNSFGVTHQSCPPHRADGHPPRSQDGSVFKGRRGHFLLIS